MRVTALVVSFVIAVAVAGADAQAQPQDSVKVGVFGYRPDGSVNVSAWDTLPSANALVFTSGSCRMGAGYRQPPDDATDAWRFSGNVLSADSEAAVVQLTWGRLLDQGSTAATESSVELRIPRGEKVVLDHVAAPASPGCAATAVLFEAHYGSRPMTVRVRPDSAVRSREGATGEGLRPYSMNLWFVRSAPGQPDEVLARPVVVITKEAVVTFAPLTLDAPAGPVLVRVTGSFEITKGSTGEELLFAAARTVTPASGSTRDHAAQTIQGTSKVTTPMPGPKEVLSFDMPPIRLPGGTELPDRLSVRVQLTPR